MTKPESPKVAVIMGSQSDWPTMKHACDTYSTSSASATSR
jgi:5-(carboxyamino)imidazole ribonucleotide mutase